VNIKVCVFEDEELTADHHLITAVGHNMHPSHAINKSCMVAAIDAELRDKDSDPILPKQQHTPQMCQAVPKRKRNEAAEESDPNDNNFAMFGEGSEDSTSDEDSVIISNVEICSNILSQHACL
jgi:hypothetical protein